MRGIGHKRAAASSLGGAHWLEFARDSADVQDDLGHLTLSDDSPAAQEAVREILPIVQNMLNSYLTSSQREPASRMCSALRPVIAQLEETTNAAVDRLEQAGVYINAQQAEIDFLRRALDDAKTSAPSSDPPPPPPPPRASFRS
ncbi:hypothetical protein IQ07DRAFT_300804 [Pyrenochaeta sp. DS3sAY3a]|nr:hypothetical protein IQ07DRAFT_300804 [Pyrenochaeta sp. DS3sAY3a]